MTDSLKLAEMQRTSIEFERQRHLANWFIKSSPHMATPTTSSSSSSSHHQQQQQQQSTSLNTTNLMNGNNNCSASNKINSFNCINNSKAQKLLNSGNGTKNGTITTTNPLFLLVSSTSSGQKSLQQQSQQPAPPQLTHSGVGGGGGVGVGVGCAVSGGNLAAISSRSQVFTSQTNLPLQIVTTSTQDGHKPKLRRFNSHDTSANMFSVAEFENARLARRNEIELKQRQQQQQRFKINSLSSGGDCSTGDSKGSKYSNDSQTEPLLADIFLERYPLPRIVKISYKSKTNHETLQSSSSNGSSSSNSSSWLISSSHGKGNNNCDPSKQCGEIFLLYRHIRQRKVYHGYNTKSGVGHRKKGVIIPQEFPGYFSLVNEKGACTATMYTTLIQLIRERVHKFISVDNLPAFTESQNMTDTFQSRTHYIKSTARGGQVFRLLAVFEDGKQDGGSNSFSNKCNSSGREKEKGRYAQLLNENRQILYVSLTTKGKFYEIEPSIPQILQKTGMTNDSKKKISPDCVHRISNIIGSDKEFPINIKFISGPSGGTSNIVPEFITVTKISMENILIACPIDDIEAQSSPLQLKKLQITPQMTLTKCFLGFENEQRMLTNQNVQNILKFCQFNCDHFLKMIELETFNKTEPSSSSSSLSNSKSRVESLKLLKPLHFPKLLRREKSIIAHEKEDSIIFLSKSDLANLESKTEDCVSNTNQNRITDKMKVFQSSKKKWFNKRNEKHNSLTNLEIDTQAKRMSMERYNDMSKLLQERFGDALTDIDERPRIESGSDPKKKTPAALLHKSFSLQEVDFLDKPDIVPANFTERRSMNDSQSNIPCTDEENELNRSTASSKCNQYQQIPAAQQSFISEKMYTEFHVKTRQYSKSSSSLHQLLHLAVPQRMNINDTKKQSVKLSSDNNNRKDKRTKQVPKNLELTFTDTFSYEEPNSILDSSLTTPTSIIDDLPYSSVRDSLLTADQQQTEITTEDECGYSNSNALIIIDGNKSNVENFLLRSNNGENCNYGNNNDDGDDDYDTKENIYAEICHDNSTDGREKFNKTISAITTINSGDSNADTAAEAGTVAADNSAAATVVVTAASTATSVVSNVNQLSSLSPSFKGSAISRVQINVISNPATPTTTVTTFFPLQQSQSYHQGASYDNIYNTIK